MGKEKGYHFAVPFTGRIMEGGHSIVIPCIYICAMGKEKGCEFAIAFSRCFVKQSFLRYPIFIFRY